MHGQISDVIYVIFEKYAKGFLPRCVLYPMLLYIYPSSSWLLYWHSGNHVVHYGDVKWPPWRLEVPVNRLFVQQYVQANKKKHEKSALLYVSKWNAPVTDGLPAQRDSNTEMFSFDDVIICSVTVDSDRPLPNLNKTQTVATIIGAAFTNMVQLKSQHG